MREIKFRAWDDENRRFFYPYDDNSTKVSALFLDQSRLNLMEWSGIKDSKGVDIYEGDIVYITGAGNIEIEFPFTELYYAALEKDVGEIKGNIFETPEVPAK